MTKWEYATIALGAPDKEGRRWKIVSSDPQAPSAKQVGKVEKPCFVGRLWQGARLLKSAAEEMDDDGWELVSHSFSGLVFYFYGVAVFRRLASETEEETE